MAKPLEYSESMGSKEAHEELLKKRIQEANDALARAEEKELEAGALDILREKVEEAEQNYQNFVDENNQASAA